MFGNRVVHRRLARGGRGGTGAAACGNLFNRHGPMPPGLRMPARRGGKFFGKQDHTAVGCTKNVNPVSWFQLGDGRYRLGIVAWPLP